MIGRLLCWLGLHRWEVQMGYFEDEEVGEVVYANGVVIKHCPRCDLCQRVGYKAPRPAFEPDCQPELGTQDNPFPLEDEVSCEEKPRKKRGRPRKSGGGKRSIYDY